MDGDYSLMVCSSGLFVVGGGDYVRSYWLRILANFNVKGEAPRPNLNSPHIPILLIDIIGSIIYAFNTG